MMENEQSKLDKVVEQLQVLVSRSDAQQIRPILFKDWAEIWLDSYIKGNVCDITFAETYRGPTLRHLIPHFGKFWVHEVVPVQVQEFFTIMGGNYSLESLKKMRTALRAIFETAIQNGHCRLNPVIRGLRLNSSVPPISKNSWTQLEYDSALQFTKQHPDGLPFLILMETGISRSELLALRAEDFNKKSETLRIDGGIVGAVNPVRNRYEIQRSDGKNSYRRRTIPISRELSEMLEQYTQKGLSGLLFTNQKGKAKDPNNWYQREYKKFMENLCAATGCRFLTPHELRHTRASLLVQNNVNLFVVAKFLGHCDLSMLSKRYLHATVEELRQSLRLN